MIVKQLSVFLENKTGRLARVAEILATKGINMTAFSVADTSDFGILRLIVSDPESAGAALRENNFSVNTTNVVCMNCPNEPGALSRALNILSDEGVELEYLYAFSVNESAMVIIRPSDVEKCIDVLQNHKIELIAASELYQL